MRTLTLLLFIASGSFALAQCLDTDLGTFSVNQDASIKHMDISPQGVFSVFKPAFNNGPSMKEVVVTKANISGVVDWHRRVIPTNTDFFLDPSGVHSTSDGGAIVYGTIRHSNYNNQFAVKLAQNGDIDWGRIYMLPDNDMARSGGGLRGMKELDAGGYSWIQRERNSIVHVMLDQFGVPTSVRSLIDTLLTSPLGEQAVLHGDGSFLLGYNGYDMNNSSTPVCARIDQTGQVDWAWRLPQMWNYVSVQSMNTTANGDYLMVTAGPTNMMRFSSAGNLLWARTFTNMTLDVFELNNGELMQFKLYPPAMSKLSATGAGIELWSLPYQILSTMGSSGDQFGMYIWAGPYFTLSPDPAGLGASCNAQSIGAESSSIYTQFTVPNNDIVIDTSSIKTWTMSLADNNVPFLDVTCAIAAVAARPGFQTNYYAYVNNASLTTSGPITAKFVLDPEFTFVSSSPPHTSISGDTLIWTGLPPLQIYENHTLSVIGVLPPDTALLGTTVTATLHASQDSVESDLGNNVAVLDRIVGASYDPNDKLVVPENVFDVNNDSLLTYTIRFQNTGTDTAFTVVLVDTLPTEVSVGSFIAGPSSHPYTYELGPQGILTFTFNNILLPDSNVNEPLSHGLVSFSVRPDEGLAIGTLISNSADIYFDFNPPVRTPPADVIYGIVTGVQLVFANEEVLVYPVPVQHSLTAVLPDDFRAKTLTLTSLDGRLIMNTSVQQVTNKLLVSVEDLAAGVYVLSLMGDDGQRLSARFVKE